MLITNGRWIMQKNFWNKNNREVFVEQNVIDYIHWQINDNGMSATSVAKQLNKNGYKGKRGGNWSSGSVLNVSRNILHERRRKFPSPEKWGSRIWHRWVQS